MDVKKIVNQHLVKDPQRVAKMRSASRVDNGFYGPDSVTWKIANEVPLATILGILRGAIQVLFDPRVAESVTSYSVMKYDPLTRARRSIAFFMLASFGDSDSAIRAGRTLYRVHSHINGTDPVTGQEYHGTDLDIALWTHALGLLAILDCNEMCGVYLTDSEKEQFVQENVAFAQLVGLEPEQAPMTVAECEQIVADWMPQMAVGLKARDNLNFLLDPPMTPVWPMAFVSIPLRIIGIALSRRLPSELKDILGYHPSAFAVRASELTVRLAARTLAVGPLRDVAMVFTPEGHGTMLQAFDADPGLPLADPSVRKDLHLAVRRSGPGHVHSDHEHSPFVDGHTASASA